MLDFIQVGDANLLAFKHNSRRLDAVAKKQEILDSIGLYHNMIPNRVLCVGFSSFLFARYQQPVSVIDISSEAQAYLTDQGIQFNYIAREDLDRYYKKFDAVIAVDEYFTYADSDQDQRDQVEKICNLAQEYVITTLRDYKNQDYRDREFSQPSLIRDTDDSIIFLESHQWDLRDRSKWNSVIYAIGQSRNSLETFGLFNRRTMYFKQLANFSATSGAVGFSVHKDLMYKGLTKRNYEHVITVKFDQ